MAIPRNLIPFRLPLLTSILLFSGFQLFSVSAFSQDISVMPTPAPLTTAQAKDFIGQTKTVKGIVMKVTTLPKTVAIDFDGVFPNAPFNAVIFNEKLPNFDKATLEGYQGKTVSVTGKIVTYKDRVQIVVENPNQFAVLADPNAAPVEAAASPSQAAATGDNLLLNPGFNKGKKDWTIPDEGDVVTNGDSQVLKVTVKGALPVVVSQEIKSKIDQSARQIHLTFQAKMAEGSKLASPLTVRLGSDPQDAAKLSPDLTSNPGKWQDIKWDVPVPQGNNGLILFLEVGAGDGTVLFDNFRLSVN